MTQLRERRDTERELVILQKRVAALSAEALERFVLRARKEAGLNGMANVLVTGSAQVRRLNRQFRGKNKATDVLSFPASLLTVPRSKRAEALAGEVVISAEIAVQNAVKLGHPAAQEVKILVLHGILHLAGLDHERDNGEMAARERLLRQKLRLPVALIERTSPIQSKARRPSKKKKRPDPSRAGARKS
jgi:probable rRNA maturation factor